MCVISTLKYDKFRAKITWRLSEMVYLSISSCVSLCDCVNIRVCVCACGWVSNSVSVYLPVGESVNVFQFWAQDYILPNGITSLIPSSKSHACPQLHASVCVRVYTCCWLHLAVALRNRLHQACFVNHPVSPGVFSPVCTGSAFPTNTEA